MYEMIIIFTNIIKQIYTVREKETPYCCS